MKKKIPCRFFVLGESRYKVLSYDGKYVMVRRDLICTKMPWHGINIGDPLPGPFQMKWPIVHKRTRFLIINRKKNG